MDWKFYADYFSHWKHGLKTNISHVMVENNPNV